MYSSSYLDPRSFWRRSPTSIGQSARTTFAFQNNACGRVDRLRLHLSLRPRPGESLSRTATPRAVFAHSWAMAIVSELENFQGTHDGIFFRVGRKEMSVVTDGKMEWTAANCATENEGFEL